MKKGLIPFLSKNEINKIIDKLVKEVQRDYADTALTFICPLKGPIFFLSDFVRKIKLDVQIDFVFIESLGKDNFRIKKDISLDIKGKHVLIVEEIIDSGLTLLFLIERLKLAKPKSLKSLVLLDKVSHRKTLIHPNYVGLVINDRFIVGYGMDMDEEARHYPDIYHLGQ